jgi:hypothetical protein
VKTGIQTYVFASRETFHAWIPAFAGMTIIIIRNLKEIR